MCQECHRTAFWALLSLLYTSKLFSILENKKIGYDNDSTLMAVVTSVAAESLIRDLGRVSEWYDLWGMEMNDSKTKTIIVSRSHTLHRLANQGLSWVGTLRHT